MVAIKLEYIPSGNTTWLERVIGLFKAVKKGQWRVLEDIVVVLSNGDELVIPKDFITDLSSVPRILWWLFSPYGDFLLAAITHDYLYVSRLYSKEFSDYQMLFISNQINSNKLDNKIRYEAVKYFGHKAYEKNK